MSHTPALAGGTRGVLFVALFVLDVLGATSMIADAQGPRPGGPNALTIPLGTGFTYQGQLKQSGALLNATGEFRFGLCKHNAALT